MWNLPRFNHRSTTITRMLCFCSWWNS